MINVQSLIDAYGASQAARHYIAVVRRLRADGVPSGVLAPWLECASVHRRAMQAHMANAYA